MGVETNECVIATTSSAEVIQKLRDWVGKLGDEKKLLSFTPSLVNAKTTLFMGPDGSKKGWPEAERGEALRNELIEFMGSFDYEDGSSPIDWVEVSYGMLGQEVLRGNCHNMDDEEP